MRSRTTLVAAFALALTAGCSETAYIYYPAEQATARLQGQPAARYPIPPGIPNPNGDLRIATLGVVQLQPRAGGPKLPFLHVRVTLSNSSPRGEVFEMDIRQVEAELRPVGRLQPALVNVDAGQPPMLRVEPARASTVDLYYVLPASVRSGDKLPAFDVVWRVNAGGTLVTQRTPFERLPVPDPPDAFATYVNESADAGIAVGLGSGWWLSPLFPTLQAYRAPRIIVDRPYVTIYNGRVVARVVPPAATIVSPPAPVILR